MALKLKLIQKAKNPKCKNFLWEYEPIIVNIYPRTVYVSWVGQKSTIVSEQCFISGTLCITFITFTLTQINYTLQYKITSLLRPRLYINLVYN